eukprot:2022259-Rhodomonas_salina.1
MQRMDFRNNNVNVAGNTLNLSLQIGAPRDREDRAVTPGRAHVQGLQDFMRERERDNKGLEEQLKQAHAEVHALRKKVSESERNLRVCEEARLQDWQRMTIFASALALVLILRGR